jgi:hypothetical protein
MVHGPSNCHIKGTSGPVRETDGQFKVSCRSRPVSFRLNLCHGASSNPYKWAKDSTAMTPMQMAYHNNNNLHIRVDYHEKKKKDCSSSCYGHANPMIAESWTKSERLILARLDLSAERNLQNARGNTVLKFFCTAYAYVTVTEYPKTKAHFWAVRGLGQT